MGVDTGIEFDGRSLVDRMKGGELEQESEMYITECTWMRKHGWRTPEWKLIHALEPDLHYKPEVELYNLIADPAEETNVAESEPEVVGFLEQRMQAHISRREQQTGRKNPMYTNLDWHGKGTGAFTSSDDAYSAMHIGSPKEARDLQAQELKTQRGADKL